MPQKTTRVISDSHTPVSWSPSVRPPLQFTADGLRELYDSKPTLAIPVPFDQGKYTCPFCNGECARNYCSWCFSTLLEDDQDE